MIDCKQLWSPFLANSLLIPFPQLCKERKQLDKLIVAVVSFFGQLSSFYPFPQLCKERKQLDNQSQVAVISFFG